MELFNSNRKLEHWPYASPPTITAFEFERWNAHKWRRWMAKNWPLSIIASCIYLLLIFVGKRFMKNRQPFNLKSTMIVWNFLLASFSTCGFIRTFPELYQVLSGPNGFHRSVCVRDTLHESSIFWAWLFTWSKLFELGDTAWIVLRKKKITLLHVYHHITVFIFCWASFSDWEPILRWFGIVNLSVHSLMYSYYMLKGLNVPVPRSISMCLTSLQMSQMICGIFVNAYAVYVKSKGEPCARSEEGINLHLMMYGSYLILFANYFYRAYIHQKPRKKEL
ncbi:putative fatty acid elongation protein 3 [Orchesella cincta]|uniref:Elongation of very long chain fatty acids protein n=1 Tax=Orchesella cincta TaxID=48709 RepID=A0A1D2NK06_ORCCI|nr:putative fatty acid elongation protein 3 [Orchesella cincta]